MAQNRRYIIDILTAHDRVIQGTHIDVHGIIERRQKVIDVRLVPEVLRRVCGQPLLKSPILAIPGVVNFKCNSLIVYL